jgi:hypothetical protein
MNGKLFISILVLCFSQILIGKAQNSSTSFEQEGTILQKSWTKTEQSYCAGGSDYYLFQTKEQNYILATATAEKLGIKALTNKKVKLKGKLVTKKIMFSPYEQHPVVYDKDGKQKDYYECTVIEVEKMTLIKK